MGLTDKLRGFLPIVRRPEYNSNYAKFLSGYGWIFSNSNKNLGDYSLYEKADNNVYVYRSIEVISDTLLINGFNINNINEFDVNIERTNYLRNLFNNPQGYVSELTYAMFHKQYVRSYELTGDAFIEVDYENFSWDNDDYRSKPSIRYEPDEIIHIYEPEINFRNMKYGTSKLDKIRLPLLMMFLGLHHNQELLENDGIDPRAILSFDKEVSDQTFENELARLSEMAQERRKGGTLAVKGATFQNSTITNQDLDFLELMKFSRDMILTAYGVQPGKAGIRETANLGTGSGESQDKDFKDMIKAKATIIEGAFNKCLGHNGFEEVFQFNEMDIEDKLKRSQIETNQLNSNVLTVNEVRSNYGYDPVPWGDVPNSMMMQTGFEEPLPGNELGLNMDALKRYENNLNKAKWLGYWSDNDGW